MKLFQDGLSKLLPLSQPFFRRQVADLIFNGKQAVAILLPAKDSKRQTYARFLLSSSYARMFHNLGMP